MIRVALAAYNEERNIGALLDAICAVAVKEDEQVSVLVVNDGSKDNTAREVEARRSAMDVTLITQPNAGFLKALSRAMEESLLHAEADDIVITMDADNTHPAELIPRLCGLIRAGSDVVIASRFEKGGRMVGVPWEREIFSAGARWVMNAFVRIPGVQDYSTAYRAYRASMLKRAFKFYPQTLLEGKGFSGVAACLIRMSHVTDRIAEVPLVLRYDLKQGASSMNVQKTLAGYAELIWRHLTGGYKPR